MKDAAASDIARIQMDIAAKLRCIRDCEIFCIFSVGCRHGDIGWAILKRQQTVIELRVGTRSVGFVLENGIRICNWQCQAAACRGRCPRFKHIDSVGVKLCQKAATWCESSAYCLLSLVKTGIKIYRSICGSYINFIGAIVLILNHPDPESVNFTAPIGCSHQQVPLSILAWCWYALQRDGSVTSGSTQLTLSFVAYADFPILTIQSPLKL